MLALSAGCYKSADSSLAPLPSPAQSSQATVAQVQQAVQQGQLDLANQLVLTLVAEQPEDAEILELAGDVQQSLNALTKARDYFQAAMDVKTPAPMSLYDKQGRVLMLLGRPFDALSVVDEAVAHYPNDVNLHRDVAGLQISLGLVLQAAEHLQWLAMRGHAKANELGVLIDLSRPQADEASAAYSLKHNPQDLRPHYGLATLAAYRGKWLDVANELRPVYRSHPSFLEAAALYGRAVVELNDTKAISQWLQALPAGIESQTDYWMAIGTLSARNQSPQAACRAYWEAARRFPDDAEALSLLAESLLKEGKTDESQLLADRVGKLAKARDFADAMGSRGYNSQSLAIQTAIAIENLGRLWEAAAWLRIGSTMTQDRDPQIAEHYARIRAKLTTKTPWLLASSQPANSIDLSSWPKMPLLQAVGNQTVPIDFGKSSSQFHFVDEAAARSLDHICRIAQPSGGESGMWIYQAGAGGAAAIDFDLDGWIDLYLTAMDGEPLQENSAPNQLHRNIAGSFVNVAVPSQTGDLGFAQGLAVSDYNSDGFDDLYIANIGRNRLYQNNGDGSFTDVTNRARLSGENWTTSAVLIDVNQDGLVDIYEAGYCGGTEPYEKACTKNGKRYACLPKSFPAQKDLLWQGLPDGTFTDVTDRWLKDQSPAHAFGVVAGFFDNEPGLDLFVANDMSANHFWSTVKPSQRQQPAAFEMQDQATARGLAVDRRSLSQASMGIAAGDPDSDGDIDFYLTHFEDEYNTFYEQVPPGMWLDVTEQLGLAEPTRKLLAFGTQFIDGNNDGWAELFVANGHLNDYRDEGRPYRMLPQWFQRQTNGHWLQTPPNSVGDYFATQRLGRSAITIDTDRDQRMDLLVTHLFDPVSLLVNRTPDCGNAVCLRLKATAGTADAWGATVTYRLDDRTIRQQLICGAGFQGANERFLLLPVAKSTGIEELTILWPDGESQKLKMLSAGREYLIVQGEVAAFELLAPSPSSSQR